MEREVLISGYIMLADASRLIVIIHQSPQNPHCVAGIGLVRGTTDTIFNLSASLCGEPGHISRVLDRDPFLGRLARCPPVHASAGSLCPGLGVRAHHTLHVQYGPISRNAARTESSSGARQNQP